MFKTYRWYEKKAPLSYPNKKNTKSWTARVGCRITNEPPRTLSTPLIHSWSFRKKKRNEIVTLSQASYDRWQGVNTSLALSKHSPFKNRYFPHIHAWSFRKQRNEIMALSQVSYDRWQCVSTSLALSNTHPQIDILPSSVFSAFCIPG